MSFLAELKRRNVYKVGVAYLIAAWLIVQVVSVVREPLGLPDSLEVFVLVFLSIGFPIALLFAWVYELTSHGLKRTSDAPVSEKDPSTDRRLNYVLVGLFIGAIVTTGVFQFIGNELTFEEIRELDMAIDSGDWEGADRIAMELARRDRDSTELESRWRSFTVINSLTSEPAGATVYRRPYDGDADDWVLLGETPIIDVRVPFGASLFRFELDGYQTVLRAVQQGMRLGGSIPDQITAVIPVVRLDTEETLPPEKIRVPGWSGAVFGQEERIQFADFFLDRHEVTNREYRQFVLAGGYRRDEYWDPIIVNGEEVPFAGAVTMYFLDGSGQPGPSTWSAGYPDDEADYPVRGVSWYEARAYAAWAEQGLPTLRHWNQAVNAELDTWRLPTSNLGTDGVESAVVPRGLSQYGNYDLSGNVREWIYNARTGTAERFIVGGAWNQERSRATSLISLPPLDRSEYNGFRLVQTFDTTEAQEVTLRDFRPPSFSPPSPSEVTPISDETFRLYESLYVYDREPSLNAWTDADGFRETGWWTRERVLIDSINGRMAIYLYVPKSRRPPDGYQAIVYAPSVWGVTQTIDEALFFADFLVRAGRVVAFPMLAGGFERPDEIGEGRGQWNSVAGRNRLIEIVAEWRLTLDYLETRADIDHDAIGFFGISAGAMHSPPLLALEKVRVKAAVLTVAGLYALNPDGSERFMPGVDPTEFLSRVDTPVLMLNGEYDPNVPLEASRAFFELLGTDEANKDFRLEAGRHDYPRDELKKNALSWFDRFLGEP